MRIRCLQVNRVGASSKVLHLRRRNVKNRRLRDCIDILDSSKDLLSVTNKGEAYCWEDDGRQGSQKTKTKIPQWSWEDVAAKLSTSGSEKFVNLHDSGDRTSIVWEVP